VDQRNTGNRISLNTPTVSRIPNIFLYLLYFFNILSIKPMTTDAGRSTR
jgi:hypothetical protein